jgi:hypothetical protein
VPVPAAAAQTGSQPSLVLTIYAGTASGASVWNIARQPLCLPVATCSSSDPHDTLRLTRDLGSGLLAGAGATYYANPHVGLTLEVFYLGMPLDDGCTGLFYNPDAETRNEQLCDNITGASLSTSAIAFFGGAVVRAAPTRAISPFVRAGAGLLSYSTGTIEMSGVYYLSNGQPVTRVVIVDDKPKKGALTVQAAAGFTARRLWVPVPLRAARHSGPARVHHRSRRRPGSGVHGDARAPPRRVDPRARRRSREEARSAVLRGLCTVLLRLGWWHAWRSPQPQASRNVARSAVDPS